MRSATWAGAVAIACAAGCELAAGLDGERSLAPTSGTARTTSTTSTTSTSAPPQDGGGADAGGVCERATYPSPPLKAAAGADREIVVALRSMDLGDHGTVVGLDLDGKCTCEGDGPSCRRPSWMAKDLCDGPGGRDAQSANVFTVVTPATGGYVGTDRFTKGLEQGSWSVLLRVTGWNGQDDDDRVTLALYASTGLPYIALPARWDGTDTWPIAQTSLTDGAKTADSPRFVDSAAYVSGGWLVGSMPVSEMYVGDTGAYMRMRLTAAFLVGRITSSPAGPKLVDGTIAARWTIGDLFEFVRSLRLKSGPVC
jgi:hypothetical protein